MEPFDVRVVLGMLWQLAVFGAYAFYRTRRAVSVVIALAQIGVSVPVGLVLFFLSFQFAPPIAALAVGSAVGWGLAGGMFDSAPSRGVRDWLLRWVLAGTVLSIATYMVFAPVDQPRSKWFVVDARIK